MMKSKKDLINKFIKPSILIFKITIKDLMNFNYKVYSNQLHLRMAIDWLILAQKMTNDGGVSASYSLLFGWQPSYPETSGYIIPTLLDYFKIIKIQKYREITKEIADWECSIQLENGAFQGNILNKKIKPTIFNTGQIIIGLVRSYKEFHVNKYLECAIKAGNFLVGNLDDSGNWNNYTYNNIPHTYNVRVAWALLELFLVTNNVLYKESAIKNLEWALNQVDKNYWINNNAFKAFKNPFLHTISYAIRGFLESGIILDDNRFVEVALNISKKLLIYFDKNKFLPATFNYNWQSNDYYSCLVGNAQLSVIWLKLFEIYNDVSFLKSALSINYYLKLKQVLDNRFNEINGAIKGSNPIYGKYLPFSFPNWAVKFFCDALMLEQKVINENQIK